MSKKIAKICKICKIEIFFRKMLSYFLFDKYFSNSFNILSIVFKSGFNKAINKTGSPKKNPHQNHVLPSLYPFF